MTIKLTKYTLHRRDLFRLTAIGAGGIYLANLEGFAADMTCMPMSQPMAPLTTALTTLTPDGEDPGNDRANIYFFIDGCYTNYFLQDPVGTGTKTDLKTSVGGTLKSYSGFSDAEKAQYRILTKARIAIHCEFEQTPANFVESVILSDENKKVIALQKFTSADFIMNGDQRRTPYVVFDRLSLQEGKPLFVTYVRRIGDLGKVFQYKIEGASAGPSRLDFAHLDQLAKNNLSRSFLSTILGGLPDATVTSGSQRGSHSYLAFTGMPLSSTPDLTTLTPAFPFNGSGGYIANAYYNQRPVPLHSVRAKVHEIKANGDFRIEIEKMHGDANAAHYMRYFLVMDPVGRILGGLSRSFDGADNTVYQTVTGNTPSTGAGSYVVKNGLLEGARNQDQFKLTKYQITDMPYVNIVTEDILDAIGKISIRLR
jgi:hypothetical protein